MFCRHCPGDQRSWIHSAEGLGKGPQCSGLPRSITLPLAMMMGHLSALWLRNRYSEDGPKVVTLRTVQGSCFTDILLPFYNFYPFLQSTNEARGDVSHSHLQPPRPCPREKAHRVEGCGILLMRLASWSVPRSEPLPLKSTTETCLWAIFSCHRS